MTIIRKKVTDFSGGITNATRTQDTKFAQMIKNFDILSARYRLKPFLSSAAEGGSVGDTEKLVQFLSANSLQYALGVVSGTSRPQVFVRASLPIGNWTADTTAASATGTTRNETLFIEYKDIIYGAVVVNATDTRIWGYAYLTDTFTETAYDLGGTADLSAASAIVVGLVHSKDDILYIGYDNQIIKKNGGGVTANWASGITLATNIIITSIFEYGNLLGIACRPKYAGGKSVVYLWDRDSTVTTLQEKIDFGTEDLYIAEELGGYIVGICLSSGVNQIAPKIVFKYSTGSGLTGAKQFLEIPAYDQYVALGGKQKVNNRLLFAAKIRTPFASTYTENWGVWSIGLIGSGEFALSFDRLLNNDTAATTFTSVTLNGFQLLGDYMTAAWQDGTYKVRVSSNPDYTATSVYESIIFNLDDSGTTKKLVSFTILTEPLPSGGQVVAKLAKDSDTSFGTTILTHSTQNAIRKTSVIDSTGSTLPQFKEIQFRLESTGNAVITGFKFKIEIIDDDNS